MTKNENINLILIHLFRPLSLGTLNVPYAIKSAKLNVDYQDIQTLNIITKTNQMKLWNTLQRKCYKQACQN